jgi:hypothetical protein
VRQKVRLSAFLALGLGWLLLARPAAASDPLPGDLVAPPPDVNIALVYNEYVTAGQFGPAHGAAVTQDTHISYNITALRLIHQFSFDGFTGGVQLYAPYVAFLGNQTVGTYLPSAAPGLLPPIGQSTAHLSDQSGFAQPNFSAYFYPLNNPRTGTYGVIAPWIAPPVSSFSKTAGLNPAQNVWTYELETGFRTMLLGTPAGRNLSVELWGEVYLYGQNGNSAYVSPAVTADNLPAIYGYAHEFVNPAIPGGNPIAVQTGAAATFREQPTEEMRVYLPYEFAPAALAFVAPGFYQSFGGKQTYKLHANGAVVDSGNRTNETQLRLILAGFVNRHTQLMLSGYYDIAARGQPETRTVLLRVGFIF